MRAIEWSKVSVVNTKCIKSAPKDSVISIYNFLTIILTLLSLDIEAPVFTKCPSLNKKFANDPNQNYAMVDLPDAEASDNSGLPPTIATSKLSPVKVVVGSPERIEYTATDDAGNVGRCYVDIEVEG